MPPKNCRPRDTVAYKKTTDSLTYNPLYAMGREYIVFDFETTSFSPNKGRVVQVAATRLSPIGQTVDTFNQLIDPSMPIPPEASAVHHLYDSDVKGKPHWESVSPFFWEWALTSKPEAQVVLVGYNSQRFDEKFLMNETARALEAGVAHSVMTPPGRLAGLDLLPVARRSCPGLSNYKQATVYEHLRHAPPQNQHDAEADVRALISILCNERILPEIGPFIRALTFPQ